MATPKATHTYTDDIARLMARYIVTADARLDDRLKAAARRALSDSIAVAMGAFAYPAVAVGRRFVAPFAAESGSVIWGTRMRAAPDRAAIVNGVLLRCYDYNDFFVGEKNSGHGSDLITGTVAAAEWVGASGTELLEAIVIGYELVGAAMDAFSTAPGGWDYTTLSQFGSCAAIARLLKLDEKQTREALGIMVGNHLAADEVESCELNDRGDLTMWKRFNAGDASRNALIACLMAQAGAEGAVRPFTGHQGFVAKLGISWDPLPILTARLDPTKRPSRVAGTYMKYWPVGSMAQSAIRAALEAREQVADMEQISEVRVYCCEGVYQQFVEMRQDAWHPISRETADHSMPYVVGAAILDGYIRTESFDPVRVLDPARQAFVAAVKVEKEPGLGRLSDPKILRAKAGYLSRVEIELADGTVVHGRALPFPGHPDAPFTDDEIAEKIRVNAIPFAGTALTEQIIETLARVDSLQSVRELTDLLAFDAEAARVGVAAE